MTKDLTLYVGVCGSSSTHGPGTLINVGANMIFAMGDGAQFAAVDEKYIPAPLNVIDPGFPQTDGCFVPGAGADQGEFRSQRMDFPHGKVLMIPGKLLDSKVPITLDQLVVVSRGNRQPFRMYYHAQKDALWICDVGQGDGGTTERLFWAPDMNKRVAAAAAAGTPATAPAPYNWGWPCIEGIYPSAQQYALYDCPSEQERANYLNGLGLQTCAPVYTAVDAYTRGVAMPAGADVMWQPPQYEYRTGILDPQYPDYCGNDDNAAITSVHISDALSMPAVLRGKVMFADRVKGCVWYFDADADGHMDRTKPPHVLIANSVIVHMEEGPDGALYMADYENMRITRVYLDGTGPGTGQVAVPDATPAPTTDAYVPPANIPEAGGCFPGTGFPELGWTHQADGTFTADLTLGVVTLTTADGGTLRTRAWNGLIPGPIIRMKACQVYYLTVRNDLGAWPEGKPETGVMNGFHGPTVTNIHTHGLHISGESPADNPFVSILPGQEYTYQYRIPCDHIGGLHWYHPHKHGAVALQTHGGAAGLIVIEPMAREASVTPAAIQTMPEQYLMIQEIDPPGLQAFATQSGDRIFDSDITAAFTLVNGCSAPGAGVVVKPAMTTALANINVEAGQWTRLRLLNVGHQYNSIITIEPKVLNGVPCQLGLLAKDGVPLADAPRAVAGNALFVSLSTRLDVAIKCFVAGVVHNVAYAHVGDVGAEVAAAPTIATITVTPFLRPPADPLPLWAPCRPGYLTDARKVPRRLRGPPFDLTVRDALNGQKFTSPDTYIRTMSNRNLEAWQITGSDKHPLHIHVDHMQLGAVGVTNQWPGAPNWNMPGDWVDSISAPGAVPVYMRPERYGGHRVMHCHIAEHSDMGIMAVMYVRYGSTAKPFPYVKNWGTCPKAEPVSTPYGGNAAKLPGTIEAEAFDLGGEAVAYHNINIDRGAPSAMRVGEASVEIDNIGAAKAITYIRDGEWLKYTVNVTKAGTYFVALNVAAAARPKGQAPLGMHWSLWLDAGNFCPAPGAKGQLLRVEDAAWNGTGGAVAFAAYAPAAALNAFTLPAGIHTLTLCFEGAAANYSFDSFTVTNCGATPGVCRAA
ncbi:hypothetical protein JKP88DRAFT_175697 [Tribonema minus]|uniref:CBM6 domain-containing protein n=1 Tax=Tribonema minus TaxID=303371 RepID=A0A835ZCB5_9STRA|nr:hypothetical protein JKP88DRAFT_175697 [Tribonema minus]